MSIRIELRRKGAVVIPIIDNKIVNARKLSSSSASAHFVKYNTMHNRSSYAVCKMCNDCKDNDGTAIAKNHTDYEVLCGSKRSTSKLVNHLMRYHRAVFDANNKVDTLIASSGTMENNIVSEKFMPSDTCP